MKQQETSCWKVH